MSADPFVEIDNGYERSAETTQKSIPLRMDSPVGNLSQKMPYFLVRHTLVSELVLLKSLHVKCHPGKNEVFCWWV
jgi:hypothetical protein